MGTEKTGENNQCIKLENFWKNIKQKLNEKVKNDDFAII